MSRPRVVRALGGRPVQPSAVLRQHRAVNRLLDEDMPKSVLGLRPPSLLDDEAKSLEIVKRPSQRHLRTDQVGEKCEVETPPNGRRGVQHVPSLRGKPIDAGQDHPLDGLRDDDRDVVLQPPSPLVELHQGSRVHQRLDQLFKEQRVAICGLEHAVLEVVREGAGADELVQELALGLRCQ